MNEHSSGTRAEVPPSATEWRTHDLKTDPDVFQAVIKGEKTFEIRFDDRGFAVGDRLNLLETVSTGEEMKAGAPLEYTSGQWYSMVKHILRGPVYGLMAGWVIMSIEDDYRTTEGNARESASDAGSDINKELVAPDQGSVRNATDMRERCARVAIQAAEMAKLMGAMEHMRVAASIAQDIRALPVLEAAKD